MLVNMASNFWKEPDLNEEKYKERFKCHHLNNVDSYMINTQKS